MCLIFSLSFHIFKLKMFCLVGILFVLMMIMINEVWSSLIGKGYGF